MTTIRHLGLILSRATTPESLSIESALERSIAIENGKKAIESARASDKVRHIAAVTREIRVDRVKVATARQALEVASKGDFKNVAALFIERAALLDLVKAQDQLTLALEEFFVLTTGGKK